jgi:hypothetical protein
MNHGGRILDAMSDLVALFATHCADRETLDALLAIVPRSNKWASARGVFDRIRAKTEAATARGDDRALAQYYFEEACAKTLVNLSMPRAPFDPDSPYWIVPKALVLAERLGVPATEITRRVAV